MTTSRRDDSICALLVAGALLPITACATATDTQTTTAELAASDAARAPLSVAVKTGQTLVFRDATGREVVLRGFNVGGSEKLYENGLLPFRSAADAAMSAQAMRDTTGANAIRFLISWEGVQPTPAGIDTAYVDRAIAQIREFTSRGMYVLVDYHQDLYSAHLFNAGSWYTGDGAPAWVIAAGNYPAESCGICFVWGQNMLTNGAVRQAAYDFWRNRKLTTSAGTLGVQDAFVAQATAAMARIKAQLPAAEFQNIVGLDPYNEPFDGGLDGASGEVWENTYLKPFYQRMRAAMDTAGWTDKLTFAEPLTFWNVGIGEAGGMGSFGALGTRFVFNSHYYDGSRMTLDFSAATDGTYASATNRIRDRAATLATVAAVTEFGYAMSGGSSDRTSYIIRAMYQGFDHGNTGASWWTSPAGGGTVVSAFQWHWDVYGGRHHELMNGNADKVQTTADGWNGEDFSVIATDAAGTTVSPRLDSRVLDRLYPTAVAGDTLAFAYEDLARPGLGGTGTTQAWLKAPSSLPGVAALVAGRQYGVLVWRASAAAARVPTELHLPRTFTAAGTAVVSDLVTTAGVLAQGVISAVAEAGSATALRLVVDTSALSSAVHVALVVNTSTGTAPTSAQLSAAAGELVAWKNRLFP